MKTLIITLVSIMILSGAALAHNGGSLDAHGCHHDHIAGGYHCHHGQLAGMSFGSQDEMLKIKARQGQAKKPNEAKKQKKD